MRLVVDTNVFVTAVLKESSLPFLVVRWIERNGGLLKSLATEQELLAVLQRPSIARVMSASFRAGLLRMLADAELVTIIERIAAARRRESTPTAVTSARPRSTATLARQRTFGTS